MDKSNIPYYQVAREALIKWNGLTEEQADKIIEQSNFEEIESQVGAQGSMKYAIDELARSMNLNDGAKAELSGIVYGQFKEGNILPIMTGILNGYNSDIEWFDSARTGNNINRNGYDVNKLVMDIMEAVHNGWIKDNASIFFTKKQDRGQQYQYLPIELIGWDEAKSDLLFIKPIIEAIGGKIDEKALKEELNNRTINYIEQSYGITSIVTPGLEKNFSDIGMDITQTIKDGKDLFDGNSPWTKEISDAFADEQFVQNVIVPQLRTKGFGKDIELMNKMAKIPNPNAENYWKSYDEFEYMPLFYDIEWSHEDGYDLESRYDDVVQALYLRTEDSKEEFEEKVSQFSEKELSELVAYKQQWSKMTYANKSEFQELESLKARLKDLKEEEKKISDTEKLIDAKENQGLNLDE